MFSSTLFRKHFLLIIAVIAFFMAWGFVVNFWIMKITRGNRPPPPFNMAKMVVTFAKDGDYISVLQKMESGANPGMGRLSMWSAEGKLLYPTKYHRDRLEITTDFPTAPYEQKFVGDDPTMLIVVLPGEPRRYLVEEMRWGGPQVPQPAGPPPSGPSGMMSPPGPPPDFDPGGMGPEPQLGPPGAGPGPQMMPPGGPPRSSSVSRMLNPPGDFGPRGPGMAPFVILVVTILMGAGAALVLIYRSFDGMVGLADHVISELQKGNLKARFPVTRKDEIGQAMMRFNTMADEIERLVERVRDVERSRMSLLQDLAHDLRTPVASLRTLLETVTVQKDKLSSETQDEILRLAQSEVLYFQHLVEDLLFLARVGEPRYQVGKDVVDLGALVQEEAHNANSRSESSATGVSVTAEVQPQFEDQSLKVSGEAHLLRRMLRNAIENAKSFAGSKVVVRAVASGEGRISVLIDDDGPGFKPEMIESFGERRFSRRIEEGPHQGRISIGLGSVIIKTVAKAHGGDVRASNESSFGTGARVEIRLPRA